MVVSVGPPSVPARDGQAAYWVKCGRVPSRCNDMRTFASNETTDLLNWSVQAHRRDSTMTRRAMRVRRWGIFVVLVGLSGSPGCRTTDSGGANVAPAMLGMAPARPDPSYRVGVGDEVRIGVADDDRWRRASVGPDGRLELADRASIHVDGLTIREIGSRLESEIGAEFRDCQVAIERCNSRFIHVFGDEEGCRTAPYRGAETLVEFLGRIDCDRCRRGYRVRVVRAGRTIGEAPRVFSARLDENLVERDSSGAPIVLEPDDYVYVHKDVGASRELTRRPGRVGRRNPIEWLARLRDRSRGAVQVARNSP